MTTRVRLRFTDRSGKGRISQQTVGRWNDTFANVQPGDVVPIFFNSASGTVWLVTSYQRQLTITVYLLVLPIFLFVLGSMGWLLLGNYRIETHQGTFFEYLTDENGRVVYDTRQFLSRTLYPARVVSRIGQLFQRP
ncbi:hypothetical protein GCM10027577_19040 [Spirosoma fluminis]